MKMPKGIMLLSSGGIEKSVDGKGQIVRGTFVDAAGTIYNNATLVSGVVYAEDGSLVGAAASGTWTNA